MGLVKENANLILTRLRVNIPAYDFRFSNVFFLEAIRHTSQQLIDIPRSPPAIIHRQLYIETIQTNRRFIEFQLQSLCKQR